MTTKQRLADRREELLSVLPRPDVSMRNSQAWAPSSAPSGTSLRIVADGSAPLIRQRDVWLATRAAPRGWASWAEPQQRA
jgi:hypothetical protein